MDHGAQRRAPRHGGASMHIRRIEPADRAALEAFLDRIPDADRTFLKEDVADAGVVAAWARPGQARSIAIDDGTVLGYVALIPLHGWSSHVGEVRIGVDPAHRGLGGGRARAPPAATAGPAAAPPATPCWRRRRSRSGRWSWRSSPTRTGSSRCSAGW